MQECREVRRNSFRRFLMRPVPGVLDPKHVGVREHIRPQSQVRGTECRILYAPDDERGTIRDLLCLAPHSVVVTVGAEQRLGEPVQYQNRSGLSPYPAERFTSPLTRRRYSTRPSRRSPARSRQIASALFRSRASRRW